MSIKETLRAKFWEFAHLYPSLFAAQQHYTALAKDWRGFIHDEDFRALKLFKLSAGAVCIDIGANRGQSVTSIKQLIPDAQITSFEPNPAIFPTLKAVASRHSNVTVHNMAVSALHTQLTLYIPRWRGVAFDQLTSGHESDKHELAKDLQSYGFRNATAEQITFEKKVVRAVNLDSLALQPEFIKIDVEGAEMDVLNSAKQTLAKHHPLLLIERGDRADIAGLLSGYDYKRYSYAAGRLELEGLAGTNSFYVHAAQTMIA